MSNQKNNPSINNVFKNWSQTLNNRQNGSQFDGQIDNEANQSQRGRAVQIAKITNGRFALDSNALSQILLKDIIRNRPVAVASIAGDMRKGKSFLLNFFLRYLQSGCGTVDDWIGKNQNQPLKGFSWRGGSQRDTIGIIMWSEPFIVKISDGQEVAVLLMDTQGAFDCEDTVKDSAIIFALSLLTSSVFIYNLHHNLQENNLDNLHVFSDYGLLALSDNGNDKPFQKLVFLIRDWSFPSEYPYGKTGGDAKIHRTLVEQKTEKNKRVRDFIEQSFEEKIGFLMSYPGKKVATNPDFKGSIEDMDPIFTQLVQDFVPLMLAPNNLIIKKIGGSVVDGQSLYVYFTAYSAKFSGNELPEPKTLLEATAEANNLIAVARALNHYSRQMEQICGGDNPHLSSRALQASNLRFRDEALVIFDTTPKMGGTEFSETHRNDLIRRLEERYKLFEGQNESKDFFRKFRPPLYVLVACFVTFCLYYLTSATGLVPLAHLFFILSTICLGLFVTFIVHLKDGLTVKTMEAILVSAVMSLIALFLLYWRQIWQFLQRLFQTSQRLEIH